MIQKSLPFLAALAALVVLTGCPGKPTASCGNGKVEAGEACDDGNSVAGDGCEADCTVTPVCGNGTIETGEACDDGNATSGDGCEANCTITGSGTCGNGVKDGTEQCDDGNQVAGDGCENNCTVTSAPGCGNGKREGTEQCDDGNQVDGDGCEKNCALTTTGNVLGCAGMNEAAPASGTCSIVPGDKGTLITGVVLGDGKTYVGGQVLIDTAGAIACVGCDCASATGGSTATKLVCPGGVISPGLINSHDHISFQGNPYVAAAANVDERFEHRHDWRKGLNGHTLVNNGGNATNAQVRWAELRQVMSGTTSIVGATYTVNGNGGLLRNLDSSGQEGLGAGSVSSDTFPLGDSAGTKLTSGCAYPKSPTASVIPAAAGYLPHVSEGIDVAANNEFLCLSQNAGVGVLSARTALVHGIGLRAADVRLVAQTHTALVWSPRSNVSLYGDTASIPLYHRQGVTIALGTDWTISGSMNLLRELKCADGLNTTRFGNALTDEELWKTVTSGGADATAMTTKIGRLVTGKVGDVAIYRRRGAATYRSIIEAEPQDVVMTMRGGKVLYGDESLVKAFDSASTCETLDVCGTAKAACIKGELVALATGNPAATLADLTTANATTYPLFACGGPPPNEPSCTPERAGPRNVKNGSSAYTAPGGTGDGDDDGVPDATDNCPGVFNPVRPMDNVPGASGQADADKDGVGDVCDPCPLDANTTSCGSFNPDDVDGDTIANGTDNCPTTPNTNQLDTDSDGKGDVCDPCPTVPNPGLSACPSTIYAVKSGQVPPGQKVALGNVLVTGAGASGFFIQVHESETGYTTRDYSGLFAYLPAHNVKVGDRVDLADTTASLFNGQLQLGAFVMGPDGGLSVASSNNPAPAPVVIADPADLVFNDGGLSDRLESVLVQVNNVTVLSNAPDAGPGDKAPLNEFVVTGGLRVNDFLTLTTPFPSVGQRYNSITGVLEWRNGNFKLEPRSAADLVAGPPTVAALEPAQAFVREGQTGTIPQPLTVRLTNADTVDDVVTITASTGDVTVADGGAIVVTTGQTSAPVGLTGVTNTDGGVVTLTATLNGGTVTSTVQVISATQASTLVAFTPATVTGSPGTSVHYTVKLDYPALAATDITLAVTPPTLGTLPATVTVAQDQLTASFDLALDAAATGTGSVTATLGSVILASAVTAQQATSDHMVLSEVAPQGTAAADEFVELYNPTNAAIDISGWKLQYKSATGATWSNIGAVFPANTSVPAHHYFLVAGKSYVGPAADYVLTVDMNLAAAAGHVRLLDDSAPPVVIDTLGYGATANAAEGGAAFTATAVAAGSYERKALPSSTQASMAPGGADAAKGNGTDTDNNAADFVLRDVREPQSLASGATEP